MDDVLGEVSNLYDEMLAYEYVPSVPEAGYEYYEAAPIEYFPLLGETPGYEYYDPSYGISHYPGELAGPGPGFFGSLFEAFKETGKELLKSPLLPQLIKSRDSGKALFPRLGVTPEYDLPPRLDGVPYTPYPRKDTGTRAAPSPGIAGISPMILLIGAGAVMLFMMRGK